MIIILQEKDFIEADSSIPPSDRIPYRLHATIRAADLVLVAKEDETLCLKDRHGVMSRMTTATFRYGKGVPLTVSIPYK